MVVQFLVNRERHFISNLPRDAPPGASALNNHEAALLGRIGFLDVARDLTKTTAEADKSTVRNTTTLRGLLSGDFWTRFEADHADYRKSLGLGAMALRSARHIDPERSTTYTEPVVKEFGNKLISLLGSDMIDGLDYINGKPTIKRDMLDRIYCIGETNINSVGWRWAGVDCGRGERGVHFLIHSPTTET